MNDSNQQNQSSVGTRRKRGADCLSDLTLHRLHGGELEAAFQARVTAHIEDCASCREARAVLGADVGQFSQQNHIASLVADALLRASQPSPLVRWLRRAVAPLAVCAGLGAAAVALLAPGQTPSVDRIRTKGGFSLSAYVQHREQDGPGALHLGEPLHPGDKLQFRYNGDAGYLAVVALDAAGKLSTYYPAGAVAARVEGGRDVPLATAVDLDETLGNETIVAVRCDEAITIDEVRSAVSRAIERRRSSFGAAPSGGGLLALDLPCAQAGLHIIKVDLPRKP